MVRYPMVELHTLRRIQVQIPQSISVLDYAMPRDDESSEIAKNRPLLVGQLVIVPLARQRKIGMIVGLEQDGRNIDAAALKAVEAILWHIPPIAENHWQYLQWLGRYYLADQGQALRLAIPIHPEQLHVIPPELGYRRAQKPSKMTAAQQAIWHVLDDTPRSRASIRQSVDFSAAALRQLLAKNAISTAPLPTPQPVIDLPKLNDEQQKVFQALYHDIIQQKHCVALLQGATGSGKTEVYFHWIAAALRQQQQVLVLLPELSLLREWQIRFAKRFGMTAPAWHNSISAKQRRTRWQQWGRGDIPVLVGARSALHLPAARLGLIIVDEEHDMSFKQEDGIAYNARDMAVIRGQKQSAVVVLASATPSLESLFNVERQHYRHLLLPQRFAAHLPTIALIDLTQDKPAAESWLSPTMLKALAENMSQGQQSLLFLNRRGFAPLLLCRRCGHRFSCQQCQSYLCQHQYPHPHLQCHHCAARHALPHQCPACDSADHLHAAGPGVERISAEVAQHFPQANYFVATADTLGDQASIDIFLTNMQRAPNDPQHIDIVIGTQIVAKGFDFADLTLVGIIDADQALWGANPRAAEQTWQLLQQVSGRAGRRDIPGQALLQCYRPDDALLQSLVHNDAAAFLKQQQQQRQRLHIPPYGRLLAIIVQSRQASDALHTAQALADHVPSGAHRLLGPIAAPLAKLKGWYRYRLLLMGPREHILQPVAAAMLQKVKPPKSVRVRCDVDPYHFH